MTNNTEQQNPAEIAAQKAIDEVFTCLEENRSFVLKAGAGAGKTTTLRKSLRFLLETRGRGLVRKNQQIACITYTNTAANQFSEDVNHHPAVTTGTIHNFLWSAIKRFQHPLREIIGDSEAFADILNEYDDISDLTVVYDLGYRGADEDSISISHDDVIDFASQLFTYTKFQEIFISSYPYVLVDEYQDTHSTLVDALLNHVVRENDDGLTIGFYGDDLQQIYGHGQGAIEHDKLTRIAQGSNFRSVPAVVDLLNMIRPELPQEVTDPDAEGRIMAFHTNDWEGERRGGSHWKGDLPAEEAQSYREGVQEYLCDLGWDFDPATTKVLMLTHNAIADELGYQNIADAFRYNDSYIKLEDPHVAYLVNVIVPANQYFSEGSYGQMFEVLGRRIPTIRSHSDKEAWSTTMDQLSDLCDDGTVGDVLAFVGESDKLYFPPELERRERRFTEWLEDHEISDSRWLDEIQQFRSVDFAEVNSLARYIEGHTPFSTKHNVKGDEFENVLVVIGRGWNKYNFGEYLDLSSPDTEIPHERQKAYQRNRNLFYVVCSRAKTNLAVLFTQELSDRALDVVTEWFGEDNVITM